MERLIEYGRINADQLAVRREMNLDRLMRESSRDAARD